MKTQYMIAKAKNTDKLAEEVQSRMDEGWMPQGGVAVCLASTLYFAQALVLNK